MLHVDEGQLHAYLDGELDAVRPGAVAELEAHLAACAVCTARLDEARQLRAQSIEILRSADVTGLRPPDFGGVDIESLPRRDRSPSYRQSLQRRATALAWAASLVAALGIGWIVRDLQVGRPEGLASREMQAVEVPPIATNTNRHQPAEPLLAAAEPLGDATIAEAHAASSPAARMEPEPRAGAGRDAPAPVLSTGAGQDRTRAALPSAARGVAAETGMPVSEAARPAEAPLATAQLVAEGRVTTDAGMPVAGAQVSVPSLNLGTLSRSDGTYSLSIPADRVVGDSLGIRVQNVGYQPLTRQIAVEPPARLKEDFELQAQAMALDEVVVTGTRTRRERSARAEAPNPVAHAAAAPPAPQAREPVSVSLQAAPLPRCSLVPTPMQRDPGATFFTLVTRGDTLLVGPGATEYVQPPARRERARTGGIFGQVVEVQRIGGADGERVEQALRQRGSREVVVVPWSTDPGCRPAPWVGSARWLPLGQTGFVQGQLRPAHLWVDGRPTLDIYHAEVQPYPANATGAASAGAEGTAPSLTAEQFFNLYSVLPTSDDLLRDRSRALEPLRRWRRQNPDLARRFPATEILEVLGEARGRSPGG